MTQKEAILDYLQTKGTITSNEAWKMFGVTRLSSVIFQLRKAGIDIVTEWRTARNRFGEHTRYAEYKMSYEQEQPKTTENNRKCYIRKTY